MKPTCEQVDRYAKAAVLDEERHPQHGRLVGCDRQAAMDDVLNHFEALDTTDEHWVREAVMAAEDALGVVA